MGEILVQFQQLYSSQYYFFLMKSNKVKLKQQNSKSKPLDNLAAQNLKVISFEIKEFIQNIV